MLIHAQRLLTPGGWRMNQSVRIENGQIVSIETGNQGDYEVAKLVPGMVDIHCHGGEGFYTLTPNEERFEKYLTRLAECGVTDVVPGLSTYGLSYDAPLDFIRKAMDRQSRGELGGAFIDGVHLEGPFLSPDRPGAMDAASMPAPSPEAFDRMFGKYEDIIRMVTLAPEREGAKELACYLIKKGICVQAGHTDATFEQAEEAFGWGVNSLCHTFNAARPIHHRNPGVVTAALLNENVFCEAICDFKHLHPGTVKMIYRMKGAARMAVISDSVAVTGLPDGEHIIDGQRYLIVDGTQRVKGGNTLSGGACYLDGSVRNLVSIGIEEADVFRMVSRTPAERLGLARGEIKAGAAAHCAAFDEDNRCVLSVIGDRIYSK